MIENKGANLQRLLQQGARELVESLATRWEGSPHPAFFGKDVIL